MPKTHRPQGSGQVERLKDGRYQWRHRRQGLSFSGIVRTRREADATLDVYRKVLNKVFGKRSAGLSSERWHELFG